MATFMNLPTELRNMIFEELFAADTGFHVHGQSQLTSFAASKQLYFEAASYFYQTREISINIHSDTNNTSSILPTIPDRYLRFVRRLNLHCWAGSATSAHTQEIASCLHGVVRAGARLNKLSIFIKSALSRVLTGRVDDAIMDQRHTIVSGIRLLLQTDTAAEVRIHLRNCWLAPGVISSLVSEFGARVSFHRSGAANGNRLELERLPSGRRSSAHLTTFGLGDVDILEQPREPMLTPSPLSASLGSALSSLDTFSASSFALGSGSDKASEFGDDEDPFFKETDIEEWEFSNPDMEDEEEVMGEMEDLDDEEMEDLNVNDLEEIPAQQVEMIMQNVEETAQYAADQQDIDYMVNFAPELLLSRHHLGYSS